MHALVLVIALSLVTAPYAAAAPGLTAPVPGAIERPFAYGGAPFARGHHRGIDLAASAGTPVRAACSGRVVFAGRAGASGRVVTLRCGRWHVTHLPLGDLAVGAGRFAPSGTPVGTVAASRTHTGLHLGVRRAIDPLGYVDPAPLLRTAPRAAPPNGPGRIARRSAQPPPHPARSPPGSPSTAVPPPATAPASSPRPGSSPPLAPWPAWAGLGLLLVGAIGAGGARARRRRCPSLTRAPAAPLP